MRYAQVQWDPCGTPIASRYGDYYFAKGQGFAESRHVFLKGNGLPQRWHHREFFVLGELGFGTGLNFLSTWLAWRQSEKRPKRLYYFALEKHPLDPSHLMAALRPYPQLKELGKLLRSKLPLPIPGFHRLGFDQGSVILTLLYGEALSSLKQLNTQVDAWYLDGFAPRLNPELWEQDLFCEMEKQTAPGGTFATYSSATPVQKHLEAAGFQIEKRKGFGKKREMLCGRLPERKTRRSMTLPVSRGPRRALIVGAGLAGAATAHALAKRGWEIWVLEKNPEPAQAGSGNPSGILFPYFSVHLDPSARFYFSGLEFTLRLLRQLGQEGQTIAGGNTGLYLFEQKEEHQRRFQKILKSLQLPEASLDYYPPGQIKKQIGIQPRNGALFFKKGSWVSPPQLVNAMLSHPGIHLKRQEEMLGFSRNKTNWRIKLKSGKNFPDFPVLILANAWEANRFPQTAFLPLEKIRGQITYLPRGIFPNFKGILCFGGYALCHGGKKIELGATFERKFSDLDLSIEEHRKNLELLKKIFPDIPMPFSLEKLSGRVGIRAATKDRWPVVGAIHKGLYVNTAHGSKGLLSCPQLGEHLASQLNGEPSNLETIAIKKMDPKRFCLKTNKS